jgi:amidohydrolase
MSEYDALPEIGHGCGHNLIAVAGAAAGVGLAAVARELGCTAQVLGTPGEEGRGGKITMIADGVFRGVDFAMMVHPSTNTRDDTGCTAVRRVRIAFRGRSSHAAASPEKGVNALDGVLLTFSGINALRQHVREDSRIHGVITAGGVKPNIVPDFAEAVFYVRSVDERYLEELLVRVENVARGAALMTGAELDFERTSPGYRSRVPCPVLTRLYREEAERLGFAFKPKPSPARGSSDAGDVSWVVPTIHPYFAIAPENVAAHSREFAVYAAKRGAIDAALRAGKAMACAAADVAADPSLLDEMRREFVSRTASGRTAADRRSPRRRGSRRR